MNSFVAERVFATPDGDLTLRIHEAHEPDVAAFRYVLSAASGEHHARTIYGADTMQALLLCIAACGDYIANFHPEATYLGLDGSCILQTDMLTQNEWRVSARMLLTAE